MEYWNDGMMEYWNIGMVDCCRLQVASCRLQVASCRFFEAGGLDCQIYLTESNE